jgi:hypothetical protein
MQILAKLAIGTALLPWFLPALQAQTVQVENCRVDFESMELPPCAVEDRDGELFIRKGLLKHLFSGRSEKVGGRQLAWTNLPQAGWSYLDRAGRVVVRNVAALDNGPSPFHCGLVRVSRNGKWGLANSRGAMVVPLEFDGLLEFDAGRWLACKGCTARTEGEYSIFAGGAWVAMDRRGAVLGPAEDPTSKRLN